VLVPACIEGANRGVFAGHAPQGDRHVTFLQRPLAGQIAGQLAARGDAETGQTLLQVGGDLLDHQHVLGAGREGGDGAVRQRMETPASPDSSITASI